MCNENKDCQCISDILKVINILQKKADVKEERLETCDKPILECCPAFECCNTRPVQLFLCCKNGNDPLEMPITRGPITSSTVFSNVFRVEKVDDCCATFRVLKAKRSADSVDCLDDTKFLATNSFFTLDLRCVCAIRCLDDTCVECV